MKVLVMEAEEGTAGAVIDQLRAAGHEVLRCHDGGPAFPCLGLAGETRCPVSEVGVDVAVTVRANPRSQPTPLEDGVVCALRQHVPLVVAGRVVLNPYGDWAAEAVEDGDVVGAVERAAAAPLRRHGEVAQAAWDATLDARGLERRGAVTVQRREGGLVVTVALTDPIDRDAADMASVRMLAALRELDPYSARVDLRVGEA